MATMITRRFTGYGITYVTVGEDNTVTEEVMFIPGNDYDKTVAKAKRAISGIGILKYVSRVDELRGVNRDDFFAMSVPVEKMKIKD